MLDDINCVLPEDPEKGQKVRFYQVIEKIGEWERREPKTYAYIFKKMDLKTLKHQIHLPRPHILIKRVMVFDGENWQAE